MFAVTEPHKIAFKELEDYIKKKDKDACLLALVTSPSNAAPLDHTYMPTKIVKALADMECRNLYFLLYALGGSIYFPEVLDKALKGLGIETVNYLLPTRAGANASLTVLTTYDKLYVNSWTIVDPFNITIAIPPASPKDLSLFLGMSEYIMSLVKAEKKDLASQISGQALSLMASHGTLYEYVEAQRLLNYLDSLIESKIKPKLTISIEEFKEIFVGTEQRPPTPVSGEELREMFKDVVVMNEEDGELSRLANALENALMELVEGRNLSGILMTSRREVLMGSMPVALMPMPS